MIRVAAVGDVHVVPRLAGRIRPKLAGIAQQADLLLLAGDLTDSGRLDEAEVMCAEYSDLGVPVVAVLGNHDVDLGHATKITEMLIAAGITVVDGSATTVRVGDVTVGIGGGKGFCGGFAGRSAIAFGEDAMKAFADHAAAEAADVRRGLDAITGDVRIALIHYAPVPDTLAGEPLELFPFLGSNLLGEALDAVGGIDLAVHGHAHYGTERGATPGGVPVRNVARPVIRAPYVVYEV